MRTAPLLFMAAVLASCATRVAGTEDWVSFKWGPNIESAASAAPKAEAYCAEYGKTAVLARTGPTSDYLPSGMTEHEGTWNCVAP
jgi:hypothetical protein